MDKAELTKLIALESVGTVVDNTGMTYPMLENGGYDADAGIHLRDIEWDGEWIESLSGKDWSAFDRFCEKHGEEIYFHWFDKMMKRGRCLCE